jgi:predicted O-linked N-acetylglucosamine transferase (SPINDLY family)
LTQDEYERLAIELATQPAKLRAIKERLEQNRLTTPLFDTSLFTQHLESAYIAAYQRQQLGLPPVHIYAKT